MKKELLERVANLAAELSEVDASDLDEMIDHLQDEGTDHDDENITSLTEAILQAVIDEK